MKFIQKSLRYDVLRMYPERQFNALYKIYYYNIFKV